MTDLDAAPPSGEGPQEALEVRISHVGARGDGVTAGPRYVFAALPGERVRARFRGQRGHIVTMREASPDRVEPACRHFGQCGGCALQHWAAAPASAWKRGVVLDALARAGVEAPVADTVDAAGEGRRRATFHAVRAKAVGFRFGFLERGSHRAFELTECPVLAPALDASRRGLLALAQRLLTRSGRLDVTATASDTGLDVAVSTGPSPTAALLAELAAFAAAFDWARLSVRGEEIVRRRAPTVRLGGVDVALPPGGFLQATQAGEAALQAEVAKALAGAEAIVDLYAGLGTFALPLGANAAVTAVEGDGDAAGALDAAVRTGSGLKPMTVLRRDLARNPLGARELDRFDAVVLDPPRAGAVRQARLAAQARCRRIAYVSCNPATFARDAKILVDGGYRLDSVVPIDQFRWSPHIELVGVFAR